VPKCDVYERAVKLILACSVFGGGRARVLFIGGAIESIESTPQHARLRSPNWPANANAA
jgi:hypothetical protein